MRMRNVFYFTDLALRKIFHLIIKIYQVTISPVLGNNCRFHPTCSQYAIDSLQTKPIYKALPLIVIRVSKCHPFHSGGYDPVK